MSASESLEDSESEPTPGGLLGELESRQDEAISQLIELEARIEAVFKSLDLEMEELTESA